MVCALHPDVVAESAIARDARHKLAWPTRQEIIVAIKQIDSRDLSAGIILFF
jgi:hypothetical protein